MHPSPLRSMLLAGLSLATAAVATVGAIYQTSPTVTLRTPPSVGAEVGAAAADAPVSAPAPGQ